MSPINNQELFTRMQNGEELNLLDVREEIEFHTFNIGGRNIPLSQFINNLDKLEYNKTDEIIVICKVGLRSETAREILAQNGYLQARNLTGGIMALQKLKY
ncbi:rhodanese-like domain-containing protein [Mucilaginibacter phenanthrenivorans]|uniref:rhodanese-like domain-containing protein n=1 Tax=Mucilaginibacter phenanthrenivorans TaxID=1234842 RepID=UPI0021581B03|nr:rhodanese-like domain-containing protein [Mucilaginibacter phenanthrenivorans]